MYTAGDGGQLENSILDIYKRHRTFNDRIFLYAKAVCCLRLLSVVKVYPICHFALYAYNIMYNMYYEYNMYVSSYMHTSVYIGILIVTTFMLLMSTYVSYLVQYGKLYVLSII